jgi:galactokinase
MTNVEERARRVYRELFDSEPVATAWAPGRLEILGNHTDYNDGYIISVALDVGIAAAIAREQYSSNILTIVSEELDHAVARSMTNPKPILDSWANYPAGVLREIARLGIALPSLRIAYASTLPIGAGLSSSAALELATAEATFALVGGRPSDSMAVARLCQRAEVEFVGVPCGILDQFSSLFGAEGHALFLDCRSLEFERVPFATESEDIHLIVVDSGVRHALVDGQYKALRGYCERAAARSAEILGRPVPKLRDLSIAELETCLPALDPDEARRAEHVVRENDRVLLGRAALRAGDIDELGRLMVASHASSRDLFGNSCPELDAIIEDAARIPGFVGGKLSGGGFGGSAVLVVRGNPRRFAGGIVKEFRSRFGRKPGIWITHPGPGARAAAQTR